MNHKKQHCHVNYASVDERFTTLLEQRSRKYALIASALLEGHRHTHRDPDTSASDPGDCKVRRGVMPQTLLREQTDEFHCTAR